MTTTADYAASYVAQLGMQLVPLPPRQKRPLTDDWGRNLITTQVEARDYWLAHPDANIGVALGPSPRARGGVGGVHRLGTFEGCGQSRNQDVSDRSGVGAQGSRVTPSMRSKTGRVAHAWRNPWRLAARRRPPRVVVIVDPDRVAA
ncbi:hypothetical protein EBT31_02645 [bacterium]|nr:hypothetical protein [bacterium]